MQQSQQQVPDSVTSPDDFCLVCGDSSTGYHYGVPSCNGCKTFFRRTIMKNQKFTCQYGGNCPIEKGVRCSCRHCRMEKCLVVGMDRNSIQQNRDPIGYTKRSKRYPPVKMQQSPVEIQSRFSPVIVPNYSHQTNSQRQEHSPPGVIIPSPIHPPSPSVHVLSRLTQLEELCARLRLGDMSLHYKDVSDAAQTPSVFLDQAFVEQHSNPIHNCIILRPSKEEDYQYWHERDFTLMIEWAKTLEQFHQLSLDDRCKLLQSTAVIFVSLLQSYHGPNRGPDQLVFPNGAYFDCAATSNKPAILQKRKRTIIRELMNPMRKMELDLTELAAFKAALFFNPGADGISDVARSSLDAYRGEIISHLFKYMVTKRGEEAGPEAFSKLLLMATPLATMGVEVKECILMVDFFGDVNLTPFAKELLLGIKNEPTNAGCAEQNETAAPIQYGVDNSSLMFIERSAQ